MAKQMMPQRFSVVHVGPGQYINCEGILAHAADSLARLGNRALVTGGKRALGAAEEPLTRSLKKSRIPWKRNIFLGECSPGNIAKIKEMARGFRANFIIGLGGGKSLDAAKSAAFELGLPVVCVPTIAATCSATTALSVIYSEQGVFLRSQLQERNPALVLVDPKILAHAPEIYLRSGILDSLAKWYEGRAVLPNVQNLDVPTAVAFQLAEVLYQGHRKNALAAVHLNARRQVGDPLLQTIDLVILVTGMIQSLASGTLFTAIAHPLHYGLTIIKESHKVLHGIEVGYGIIVQLRVERCPKREFDEVVSFFRQLGLEPTFKGLNLPFDRNSVRRVAEKAAAYPNRGPLAYPVTPAAIVEAMEWVEKRFG